MAFSEDADYLGTTVDRHWPVRAVVRVQLGAAGPEGHVCKRTIVVGLVEDRGEPSPLLSRLIRDAPQVCHTRLMRRGCPPHSPWRMRPDESIDNAPCALSDKRHRIAHEVDTRFVEEAANRFHATQRRAHHGQGIQTHAIALSEAANALAINLKKLLAVSPFA